MHLVVGMLVKDRAWVLPRWFEAVESQGYDIDMVCVASPSSDNTDEILRQHDITVIRDERPGRDVVDIDQHFWGSMPTYEYMADIQNKLLDYAREGEADLFFSLDSDIILPDNSLKQLIDYAVDHPGVVAPAVNLTTGEIAWNRMSWVNRDFPQMGERLLGQPTTGPADVVLAAMLMDKQAMECRFVAHPQAQDVGFCVLAEHLGIPRWWVHEVRCQHLMRKM